MKPEQIQQLLDSTTVLVEANSKLVGNNSESINLLKSTIKKNDDLNKVAIQIYQGLNEKKNKTAIEIGWFNALQEIFKRKA